MTLTETIETDQVVLMTPEDDGYSYKFVSETGGGDIGSANSYGFSQCDEGSRIVCTSEATNLHEDVGAGSVLIIEYDEDSESFSIGGVVVPAEEDFVQAGAISPECDHAVVQAAEDIWLEHRRLGPRLKHQRRHHVVEPHACRSRRPSKGSKRERLKGTYTCPNRAIDS